MKLKWERNSRTANLLSQGKIHPDDIIQRTTTDKFPFGAATVRMRQVRENHPHITVHIRGPKQTKTNTWNNSFSYDYASTCRINFGGSWQGKRNTAMDSSGDLDENLNWLDVHNIVERVKETLQA